MIIPVILGPTCIGKTSLALKVAKEVGADILSVDSRQVFKYLDIGTGKYKDDAVVSKNNGYWEIDGIKIWGYDFLEPDQELNVLVFCEFAKKIIELYKSENKKLIITCGTGFYLKFLMGEVLYNEIDSSRKEELNKLELSELLKIYYTFEDRPKIDEKNKLRIITSILNLENPNKEKKQFKIEGVSFYILRLVASREELYQNSDLFVSEIISKNVITEYENVLNDYGKVKALDGLIYSEIRDYKENLINRDTMASKMKFSLHSYIRRQETLFNKMKIDLSFSDRNLLIKKLIELL